MSQKTAQTLILSDCHLRLPSDASTRIFQETLKEWAPKIERLVLLGDIFDFFYGPTRYFQQRHRETIEIIKETAASGVEVLWFEGNHEFSLLKLPLEGVTFVADRVKLFEWYGHRTALSHGDLIYASDAYLSYLNLIKSNAFQYSAKFLPQKLLETYGLWQSVQSRSKDDYRNFDQDACLQSLATEAIKHNASRMIVGHFHFKHTGFFELNGHSIQLACQPSWQQNIGGLILSENGIHYANLYKKT